MARSARNTQINMRSRRGDHTVSISRTDIAGKPSRFAVTVRPDDPLTYGYDEAGTVLDEQSMRRLLAWLTTGEAPAADADLPDLPAWGETTAVPPTSQP